MTKLTFVGTSIGNLADISLRAIETLFEADVVLAEDTRVYGKLKGLLLERYGPIVESITEKQEAKSQNTISYRDQNHDRILPEIMQFLNEDKKVVMVSDAGMPGISDPGFKLVRDLYDAGFEVDVIPGASAVNSALLLSGLPTDRYTFVGFLPRKGGRAKKLLSSVANEDATVVLFESPFRVLKTLGLIEELFGEEASVAAVAEITKLHQAVHRGTAKEIIQTFGEKKLKGEWVICYRIVN